MVKAHDVVWNIVAQLREWLWVQYPVAQKSEEIVLCLLTFIFLKAFVTKQLSCIAKIRLFGNIQCWHLKS